MHAYISLQAMVYDLCRVVGVPELSTGRMDPRVGSGHDFAGFWWVGSGQHFGLISFLLIISWYLNRCESSNITFQID